MNCTEPLTPPNRLLLTHRKLFLREFIVPVAIGIHDFELSKPQRISFDIAVFVPLVASSSARDSIADVVDYDFIRTAVFTRVSAGHINLQETLCDDVVTALLAHPGVAAVQLSTQKLDVYPDCAGVGCEVFRSK